MAARFAGGLLPGVAVVTAPDPVVQGNVVACLQLPDEPLPDRLDHGPFALELGVLGVVHAVRPGEAARFLIRSSRALKDLSGHDPKCPLPGVEKGAEVDAQGK